jgi:RimJ/RimL family protein N-acetyltransferase
LVFGLLRTDGRAGTERRLEGDRLVLRPFGRRDAFDIVDAVRDDAEIHRWLPWAAGYNLERALEWCTRLSHATGPGYGGNFAIEPREGGRLAGAIGVQREDHERGDAELGYWISPWARRKGYAVEATRMVAAYLFQLGFHRVHLLVATGNQASQAVARRAGFIEEGILRRALPVPGGRADAVLFGMLNGEFSWQ